MASTEQVPLHHRLLLSATAGCAASTFCHPLDVLRIQLQTDAGRYTGAFDAAVNIVRRDGVTALWDGLTAAYLRQFTYSMVTLGVFSYSLDSAQRRKDKDEKSLKHSVGFGTKMLLGGLSGAVGAFVGNPAEVAVVRMCNDSILPQKEQRNYRSSIHAVVQIAREEGVAGRWL